MNDPLEMSSFAKNIMDLKFAHSLQDGTKESWTEIVDRVVDAVMSVVDAPASLKKEIKKVIVERKFIPAGRYLYAAGNPYHQVQNCLCLRAEDSREGWSDLLYKSSMALMTGAGIGIEYSRIRGEGKPIRRTGGIATGPLALMDMINEVGRGVKQGGSRRSAIWAGISWNHPDVYKFITAKNWSPDVTRMKEKDFNFPARLDNTNISIGLDDLFFEAFNDENHSLHSHAQSVYWAAIKQMLSTAEPGFTVNVGKNSKEILRNACTEISSRDDSDICNLGSINLAKIVSVEEMERVMELATLFLLAGTVYSDVPYPQVDQVRSKNRRLGLGLMGVHEWLLTHNFRYERNEQLEKYLKAYTKSTVYADEWADKWDISRPIKTRAIAPTGTIGILAETTTGIEPLYCAAYKRRYLKHNTWCYEYVIDPTAKRLIDQGINPDSIEDAYSLAQDVDRRLAFQAWIQQFVDHCISSTINLPTWGSENNNESTVQNFGRMLLKYLRDLRGITVYPDGARSGQPLTPVRYGTAIKNTGDVFYETTDICDITKRGSCGS
jgi:ribonucleoside-diphosphate reductase alpha chain